MTEDSNTDGGFFNRWSARKRRRVQAVPDEHGTTAADSQDADDSVLQYASPNPMGANTDLPADIVSVNELQVSDDEPRDSVKDDTKELPPLCDEDMPPVESLTADSDISAFFSSGVSAALRRTALRHVFHQPKFNIRDGLNDYDGDYTVFEPLGDTITSDMKWHTARKEKLRQEEEAREQALAQEEALEAEEHKTLEEESAQADEHEAIDDDRADVDSSMTDDSESADSEQPAFDDSALSEVAIADGDSDIAPIDIAPIKARET